MSTTIAITSNWQLHIPQVIRGLVGFQAPGEVVATVKTGVVTLRPKKSKILSLAGDLHLLYKKKPINLDRVRDEIDYTQA